MKNKKIRRNKKKKQKKEKKRRKKELKQTQANKQLIDEINDSKAYFKRLRK